MQKFIGVKIILAMAMTVGQAMRDHGVKLSPDPSGKDREDDEQGYLVEYDNGYKSWTPKDVFDAAYRPTDGLTFGLAIEALKLGKRVARSSWDSSTWLILTSNRIIKAFTDGSMSFGVQVSNDELFAEDWLIVQ